MSMLQKIYEVYRNNLLSTALILVNLVFVAGSIIFGGPFAWLNLFAATFLAIITYTCNSGL
jgi:uncharacterized membrane protein